VPVASADRPRRLPAPARRARIVAAAIEAFSAKGYEGTSMGEIAAAAGVTRPVLYDHFSSKLALFLALLFEQDAELVAHVGERIAADGPAAERMRATADAFFAFAEERPHAFRLLFSEIGSGDPEVHAARARIHAQRTRAVATLLSPDAARAGIGPGERAEIMVELLIAGLSGVARWWEDHPDVARSELTAAAVDTVWVGLEQLSGGHD
jgi:AcrR family transcriptional regulator